MRTSNRFQAGVCIETKGGPIQTAASHAVCRLGGREVIAADSRGLVTLLGEEQIFTRKSVSQHAVQFVAVDEDSRESRRFVFSVRACSARQGAFYIISDKNSDIVYKCFGLFGLVSVLYTNCQQEFFQVPVIAVW